MTQNSSPPKRATVSPGRSTSTSRAASRQSSSSPAPWPSESLTSLKRSRSMNSTATEVLRREAWFSASDRRSISSVRLGRPVSGSCKPWRRICSSARRRSIASASTLAVASRNAISSGANWSRGGTKHPQLAERRMVRADRNRQAPRVRAGPRRDRGRRPPTEMVALSSASSTVRPIVTVSCSRPRRSSPSSASRPSRATAVCWARLRSSLPSAYSRPSRAPSSASAARPTSCCIRLNERANSPTSSRVRTWTGMTSTRALALSSSPVESATIARVRSASVPVARRLAAADICSTAWAMMPGSTRPTVMVRIATTTKMSWSSEMSAASPVSTELTASR